MAMRAPPSTVVTAFVFHDVGSVLQRRRVAKLYERRALSDPRRVRESCDSCVKRTTTWFPSRIFLRYLAKTICQRPNSRRPRTKPKAKITGNWRTKQVVAAESAS
ncbi:unnamed protein product [Amoebophrya sp. A120]|nr:unnamed protein product [Amoebophrya sp. A120]|eukprot:GSA120T00020627001.1